MNRSIQNMPLAVDPAGKDQTRINREITEVVRQLWLRANDTERLVDALEKRVKALEITTSTP